MFERYTERARRTIFFARYEASRLGVSQIDPVHLLLALLREDLTLRRMLPGSAQEEIRRTVDSESGRQEKIATSTDLPLSPASKRVLAYGAEESERQQHGVISPLHLTMGLLRERSRAAEILEEHGITLDRARAEVGDADTAEDPQVALDGAEARGKLHELIDGLPDDALPRALLLLTHTPRGVTGGGIAGAGMTGGAGGARGRIVARLREHASEGGSAVSFPGAAPASLRLQGGEAVIESHRFHLGHEIALVERLRVSEDGNTLHYSLEARGPKGTHTWSGDFEL